MLVYFVFFVSMNILMVRMEDNIIKIEIKEEEEECNVTQEVTLVQNSNFTLEIKSVYFIVNSTWNRYYMNQYHNDRLEDLPHSNLGISYERSKGSKEEKPNDTLKYTYSHYFIHNQHPEISPGHWNFTFVFLKNYDPWSVSRRLEGDGERREEEKDQIVVKRSCSTTVKIDKREESNPELSVNAGSDKSEGRSGIQSGGIIDFGNTPLIIVLVIVGALLLAQTTYIITGKIRGRRSNKNSDEDPITPKSPKVKRGSKPETNIADRPPLPLPPDEVIKDQPGSPVSPRPKRHHHYPSAPPMPEEDSCKCCPDHLVPKQPYRHMVPDNSDDEVRSPGFIRRHRTRVEGPLAPKPSFKNRAFHNSEDELRSPGFARRHEGPLVPKKPYKNKPLENSREELRSPEFGRRRGGPFLPKQSYINKELDDSDEEIGTPNFARRQAGGMLVQLPPKGVNASKSFKNPIPSPRNTLSPPTLPEKPPIYPSPRKEPAPPLHPKKVAAVFPSQQETGRPQDSRRFSDDEWQYEQLQPASKYLNKFTYDKPYL